MIKPGCLCLLRNLPAPKEWNGRVVTAVRFKPGSGTIDLATLSKVVCDVWEVRGPWMTPGSTWQFHPRHLVPISDPDADVEGDLSEKIDFGRFGYILVKV